MNDLKKTASSRQNRTEVLECKRVPQYSGMEYNKGLLIWGQTHSKGSDL